LTRIAAILVSQMYVADKDIFFARNACHSQPPCFPVIFLKKAPIPCSIKSL
jgi:hypothetical protein